jgi:hypothetical protein
MSEFFTIRIVKEDNTEILLEKLTEKVAMNILSRAYESILNEQIDIEFTDTIKINALNLRCFYIA